jgi:formate/nitrite transporter FocA (FNT family)
LRLLASSPAISGYDDSPRQTDASTGAVPVNQHCPSVRGDGTRLVVLEDGSQPQGGMVSTLKAKNVKPSTADGGSDLGKEKESEAKKPYKQILKEEVVAGMRELRRPAISLFLSGLSAGLDVGFSLLLMATMLTLAGDTLSKPVVEILVANVYAVGIVFVVLGRSELFTEHTTLAVLPMFNGQATLGTVIRLWALVYAGNLLGAAAFAALASYAGPLMGLIDPHAFGQIARRLVDHPPTAIFLGGLLAGWLMGLLSWLVTAARDTISQIVIVWIIATVIGFAHLQHPIVGSVEVLAAVFSRQGVTMDDYGRFLLWSTIGSALGGVVFVALVKFSHVSLGTATKQPHE